LRGGDGKDFIFNSGDVSAEAISTATSAGSSYAEFGGSASRGEMSASLIARGIDGGAGDDVVVNLGTITARGTSSVSSTHSTDTGILFGGGDSIAAGSATLSVFGIDAGNGDNAVVNKGAVSVDLFGSASVMTNSDGADIFDGDAFSQSDSTVTATAVGIRAGDGNDVIVNRGSVDIKTSRPFFGGELPMYAIAVANADGDGIDGDGTIRSYATANLTAVGIDAGNGNNRVENHGTITIDARAFASATGTVDADAGGTASAIREARVNANAVGIRTGSGNDTVINKGAIAVTATAFNDTGSAHIKASATGIDTGAGNDTIINAGTITATTVVNGVSSPGTAINAGAGDDMVKLTNGSVTNGNIDLGSGNNQLVLEGTPVISGTVLDGSSGLALVFNAAGSYGGALPGVSATKNGPGTFTLSNLNRMQRIEVNQGTLKLDNNYAFLGDGVFQAKVNGNGSYGQFYVNGRAALDGTMKIVRGDGAYVNGASFDVLTASKGVEPGTAFSRVESPDDTRLLKFHTEQLPDGVRVKADVASFTTVAGTPNQMAIARNLDRILPKTSGTLNQVLGKIQALPDAQFASAFASMSPAVYAGYTASTFNTMQQYTNVLQDRMTVLRAGDLSPAQTAGASNGEPIRLAYNGKGLSELLEAGDAERTRSSGLWLRGFSQKGDQNATDDVSGYDYRMAGTSVGYDRRLTDALSAGVSLGTARNNTHVDGNVSQGTVDSTMGSIYAGYFHRRVYVNGTLSAGRNKYDTQRTNTVDQSTSSSNHDGKVLAATVGAGSYVQAAAWWVEPFATVQYTRVKEDGFSETGGSVNQTVEDRSTNGIVSTLGARAWRPIEDGNGALWVPQASLAWLHDYSKNQVINASYTGAPDSSFSIDGQPVQRNGALVGLGLSYRSKGGYITTFQYTGEFRDGFSAHGLAGEFRWEF
jgi:outer membrane autotransporter protein